MSGLLTSAVGGTLLLALLLGVLLRRGLWEARGITFLGSNRLLVALLVLFTLQVVARFVLLYG